MGKDTLPDLIVIVFLVGGAVGFVAGFAVGKAPQRETEKAPAYSGTWTVGGHCRNHVLGQMAVMTPVHRPAPPETCVCLSDGWSCFDYPAAKKEGE
jgi:hypothetical protein